MASQMIERNQHSSAARILDQVLVASPRNRMAIDLSRKLEAPYSPDFYQTWLPGMIAAGDHMLGHLFKYHVFDTVIDFGAGVGAWLNGAHKHGARKLLGIEGEWVRNMRVEGLGAPVEYLHGDLNDGGLLASLGKEERFDLAICVEVAEHVLPERSLQLVHALCQSAPTVVFGGALPRQWGNGHINCRSHRFWADIFASHGYRLVDFFRPYFWFHRHVPHWYAQNTFLFVSDQSPQSLKDFSPPPLLDVYHPGTVNNFVIEDHRRGMIEPDSEYL